MAGHARHSLGALKAFTCLDGCESLVAVFRRVVFRRNDKPAAFPRASIDGLNDVNHLEFVVKRPIDLIVVARAEIDHYVLVPEEKHDSTGVVELVHGVEIGHFRDVDHINRSKILHVLRNAAQHFVHLHARRVVVMAKAEHDHAVALVQDRLVDGPAALEVRQ